MCGGGTGRTVLQIDDSESLSDEFVYLQNGHAVLGVALASTWNTAAVSFAVTTDPVGTAALDAAATFVPLFVYNVSDGTFDEAQIDAGTASRTYTIPGWWTRPYTAVKVRSGLVGAATAQTGDTLVTLVTGQP